MADGAHAPIAISMGEPAGVGPEVAMAAFDHFGGQIGGRAIRLVGDADIFSSHRQPLIHRIVFREQHAQRSRRVAPIVQREARN